MIDVFERADGPVIAVERVPEEQVSSYGIIDVEPAPDLGPGVYRIRDMVEKPPRAEAPSESRDHRPLHPHAGYLPRASRDRAATSPAKFS